MNFSSQISPWSNLSTLLFSFFLVLTCAKHKLLNAVGLILVSSAKSPSQLIQGSGSVAPYHVEKKERHIRP